MIYLFSAEIIEFVIFMYDSLVSVVRATSGCLECHRTARQPASYEVDSIRQGSPTTQRVSVYICDLSVFNESEG